MFSQCPTAQMAENMFVTKESDEHLLQQAEKQKQEREDNANDAAVETTSLGSKELERAPPHQCKSQRCKQVPSVASKCPKQAEEPVALHIYEQGQQALDSTGTATDDQCGTGVHAYKKEEEEAGMTMSQPAVQVRASSTGATLTVVNHDGSKLAQEARPKLMTI